MKSKTWWTIILGVLFLSSFIYYVGDTKYENYYSEKYVYEEIHEQKLVSKNQLPITYHISYYCSDYMKERIRGAFDILEEEVDYILSFSEIQEYPDIEISCTLSSEGEVYTAGEATLGVIGQSVEGSEINFYNLKSKVEVYSMGACYGPDTEIHEILHTFGFDHSKSGIMNDFTSIDCPVILIGSYITECLKYTYSDGTIGTDCSNRSDVNKEYEYEDCDYGWYDATNSNIYCCPEPYMYIDKEGYCNK